MTTNSTTIGSLAIGINIIDVVAASDSPLKFSEIQEKTQMTKSNLYKYLNTLTQLDMLYRDPKQGDYSLGYKLSKYGSLAIDNADIISRMTPYFKEISKLTNMTTIIASWINDRPLITNIWNTNFGLNIGAHIGTQLPPHSAAGKIFAAFASSDDIKEWIQREFEGKESDFIDQFYKELPSIRKDKLAFSNEPLVPHVSSFSLPILDFKNNIIAAVTIVGFTEDIPKTSSNKMVKQVTEIVDTISRVYGYRET